jgi:hypothetical protein
MKIDSRGVFYVEINVMIFFMTLFFLIFERWGQFYARVSLNKIKFYKKLKLLLFSQKIMPGW